MPKRLYCPRAAILLACAGCLVCAGCGSNALTAALDTSYDDPVQEIVNEKIDAESVEMSPQERYELHREDVFQAASQRPEDPAIDEVEAERLAMAERLVAEGALTVSDCLAYSLALNDRIRAARSGLRSIEGQRLIVHSRFLPRVTFDLAGTVNENIGRNLAMGGRAAMTLLEFGRDNPSDVALRQVERDALFEYERVVADVLFNVRLQFYQLQLRKRQLAERQRLREGFQADFERLNRLAEAQRIREIDLLTARLNVLNEDQRINRLERDIRRLKLNLLKAVGLPVSMHGVEFVGELEPFHPEVGDAVEIAFVRSTEIAQARAAVYEQDRRVRQIIWDYMPGIRTQAGYRGTDFIGGFDVTTRDGVYSADPFAERTINSYRESVFAARQRAIVDRSESGWYWSGDVEWTILSGLERTGLYRRENAFLDQQRFFLSDTVWNKELAVRRAYQTVLELEGEVEVVAEQVTISRERLRVNERLKQLGMISDNDLETFRDRFFADQDNLFETQIRLVGAQEELRRQMRFFEPVSAESAVEGE